jgi:tRNA pseudouridine13 synthase
LTDPAQILALPCAHGGPAGRAVLRAMPEDFIVREWLGFDADGDGEHLLLRVRKRDANTLWVAKQLARMAKLHPRDVGFAGLKDRNAIADQAFTVPVRSAVGMNWAGVAGEGFEVLGAERHRRKLKRGALRGNEFAITLRSFDGEPDALEQRLRMCAVAGVPNYFGPQRFGRDGRNVAMALAWFRAQEQPPDRAQRGFALSAARAVLFNAVLAARVSDATWNRLQPGEIVNLNGTGSIFAAAQVDATLIERCERLDIHPTGPLWGAGASGATAAVGELEQRVADNHADLAAGLAAARLEPERRPLRVAVEELQRQVEGADVQLRFRLRRGSFATAVLHELIGNAFAQDAPEGDD